MQAQALKCHYCGGVEFHHDQLKAGGLGFPITVGNIFQGTYVNCSVCLSCGFIALHIGDGAVKSIVARKAKRKS
jgi:hypothetical protein